MNGKTLETALPVGPQKRNGLIELCRFLFALCVVSHHAIFLENHGHIPVIGGYIAVEYFYILTGYFLYQSSQKMVSKNSDSALHQVCKRLKKIYPYFVMTWLGSFAVAHVINGTLQPFTVIWDLIRGIPQLLFLSMTGLGGASEGIWDYVGTGWYVSALMIGIFVLYPLMRSCKKYFGTAIAPVTAMLIYGWIIFTFNFLGVVNERAGFCYFGCLRAIAGLCMGSFCYQVVHAIPKHRLTKTGDTLVSLIQLVLIGTILIFMEFYKGYNDIIQVILFSALIIVSLSEDSGLNRLCSGRVSDKLGEFSMVIFITQSLSYMYPVLSYPEQWPLRYGMHYVYILIFSLANYWLVALLRKLWAGFRVKEHLVIIDKEVE